MNEISWKALLSWSVVVTIASYFLFLNIDKAWTFPLLLVGFGAAKGGIVYLTIRNGGLRVPSAVALVWYSASWIIYIGYITALLIIRDPLPGGQYTHPALPIAYLSILYANMLASAIMATATYPWTSGQPREKRRGRRGNIIRDMARDSARDPIRDAARDLIYDDTKKPGA